MQLSDLLPILKFAGEKYMASATRGIVILGGLYLIFWVFKRPWMDKYRVPTIGAAKAKPAKEALLTFSTYIIYTIVAVIVMLSAKAGHSMMYTDVAKYGWFYTIFSVVIFCVWSDTTFYWSHVLMHKSKFVYRSHVVHHQFVNTTPWAAYAFHVGESAMSAGFFGILMLIMPWHPMALFVFVVFSVTYNGVIHLGYDFFPVSWRQHPVLKYMNTTTHHIYHHQKSDCNYSFIFTFWDKWMGTESLPAANEVRAKQAM
jgi:lathosterol oxidase